MKFSEEVIQAVAQLELYARKNVAALLSGDFKTAFRGSGMQFKEFRRYEPGDDVRHMSWPVTARTRKATLKTFEEERELDVILMVDASGSSLFSHTSSRKLDMYGDLVALMGLAALKSGDNLGLILFSDRVVYTLPPSRSRQQVSIAVGSVLEQTLIAQKSDLRPALAHVRSLAKTRSLIIILSDFLMPTFETEFISLSKKHETVLIQCFDDAERGLHLDGVYEVWDPETGEFHLLDGHSVATRRLLASYHVGLENRLRELTQKAKSDYLCLSVEDDYLHRLVHFFRRRGTSRL